MNATEKALDFIGSQEMRDYLKEQLPKWRNPYWACLRTIAFAPTPIGRKLAVLERLAMRDAFPGLAELAEECRKALSERYDGPSGAIFYLQEFLYPD